MSLVFNKKSKSQSSSGNKTGSHQNRKFGPIPQPSTDGDSLLELQQSIGNQEVDRLLKGDSTDEFSTKSGSSNDMEDLLLDFGEEEKTREDTEKVNRSLKPSVPMETLQDQFAEVLEEASDYEKMPDYIQMLAQSNEEMYDLPPDEARAEMNKLVHLHKLAQAKYAEQNVKVLARFFVQDENSGVTHPGLNSWAHLAGERSNLSDETVQQSAKQHMKYGHDVPGKEGIMKNSPFVSTTEDLGMALLADSKYNKKKNMARMTSRLDAPGDNRKTDLRKQMMMKKSSSAPSEQVGGKYYSERIDRLIYGHGSEGMNRNLMSQAPVANKLAFIAVNSGADHLYTPEDVQGEPMDCCTLEAENTVFAPDQDLNELALHIQDNSMVALKNEGKL